MLICPKPNTEKIMAIVDLVKLDTLVFNAIYDFCTTHGSSPRTKVRPLTFSIDEALKTDKYVEMSLDTCVVNSINRSLRVLRNASWGITVNTQEILHDEVKLILTLA